MADKFGVLDKILFKGFLSKDEIFQEFLDSDLFVLPTKAEGLPRVLIEAMSSGLPCISTNVSGNGELLSDDFLFEYSDVNGITQKILQLVSNPMYYESSSKDNFNKSQKYRSIILQKSRDDFYNKLKKYTTDVNFQR